VRAKFETHAGLQEELVENASRDYYWGAGGTGAARTCSADTDEGEGVAAAHGLTRRFSESRLPRSRLSPTFSLSPHPTREGARVSLGLGVVPQFRDTGRFHRRALASPLRRTVGRPVQIGEQRFDASDDVAHARIDEPRDRLTRDPEEFASKDVASNSEPFSELRRRAVNCGQTRLEHQRLVTKLYVASCHLTRGAILRAWFMALTSSLVHTASGSRTIREARGRISSGRGVVAIRPSHQGAERKFELSPNEQRMLDEARRALKYPAVEFTGVQARGIGRGFANAVASSQFTI